MQTTFGKIISAERFGQQIENFRPSLTENCQSSGRAVVLADVTGQFDRFIQTQRSSSVHSGLIAPLIPFFTARACYIKGMISPEITAAEWATRCKAGDRRALSRLITLLESNAPQQAAAAFDAVAAFELPRHIIGITGPPGAGKSTLIDYLAGLVLQTTGRQVAILAIDPSSPFTGGALLGDRIRMSSLRNEPRAFIRSMGSRGASGGLAAAASGALRVLGAAGIDTVFLETVGAGQSEIAIANLAHTVCVVQVPGMGDEVQLMKMGILEAADVFAVNKADKPEAAELKARLELAIAENPEAPSRVMRQLGKKFAAGFNGPRWTPPVILLSAARRENGAALLDALQAHRLYLDQPELRAALTKFRSVREIMSHAEALFRQRAEARFEDGSLDALSAAFADGTLTLDSAAKSMLRCLAGDPLSQKGPDGP